MQSNFEKLDVWKQSCRLNITLYKLLQETNEYWIKDQMLRSALSIPSNISEGCERNSALESKRFLNIAKASAAELRTKVYIARKINIISNNDSNNFIKELKKITKMLQSLINSIKITKKITDIRHPVTDNR